MIRPNSPPAAASGTVSMMTAGVIQLSNWAASTRNTSNSASPKAATTAPPDSRWSRAAPSHWIVATPGGCLAISASKKAMASPMV